MFTIHDVSYRHPNRDLLFTDVNLMINKHDKVALVGSNGSGKSTLLEIMAGIRFPSEGHVKTLTPPYLVPQHFGQYNDTSVAAALKIEVRLNALKEILKGNVTDENLTLLNDDWSVENRCDEALHYWGLMGVSPGQKMSTLSGGQKTKVFLAGIQIHQPELVLLDEPSNHLDLEGRELLYRYVENTKNTLVTVSHDRSLLNLLNATIEIGRHGLVLYGGNYDFYSVQKELENDVLVQELRSKEKLFRNSREVERQTVERQQKLDARGKKKQEKAGLPTISMNTLRNNAEKSTARIKNVHDGKVGQMAAELTELRKALPDISKMKMNLDDAVPHHGKRLITAIEINVSYSDQWIWKTPLSFQINSGDRIAIKGPNGAGKTSLIRMILGQLQPGNGTLESVPLSAIYVDQDYSLINNSLSVYEMAEQYNSGELQEHDIKIRLNRFLFTKSDWSKPCAGLSGGEKMRLTLCMLGIAHQSPGLIVLDEPTNNLDIENVKILTDVINQYAGTLIVVSHDEYFLTEINTTREIRVHSSA